MGELSPSRASRRVAFLFAFLTAGFGFYEASIPPLRHASPGFYDLVYVESHALAGLLNAPHQALVLLGFAVYLRILLRLIRGGPGGWAVAGVGAAGSAMLSLIHPDKAVVVGLTTLTCLVWTWRARGLPGSTWLRGGVAVAGGIPYSIVLVAAYRDPRLAAIARVAGGQTGQQLHPDPLFYLLGFGIPGLLALSGAPFSRARLKRASPAEIAAWSMVAASVVVALIPSDLIEHRFEGVQLVLAAIAARRLVHRLLPRLWRSGWFRPVAAGRGLTGQPLRAIRSRAIGLVVAASMPTALAGVVLTTSGAVTGSRDYYLGQGEPEALAWLRARAGSGQVVAATPPAARFVAVYAGTRVAFGNPVYSPGYSSERRALVDFFLSPGYDRRAYLEQRRVDYLYFGPLEKAIAVFDPGRLPYLRRVFSDRGVTIYRVAGPTSL